jgi:hypothetical protein
MCVASHSAPSFIICFCLILIEKIRPLMSICCYGSTAARKSWRRICDYDLDVKKLAARKRRFQSASATVGCQTDISLMTHPECAIPGMHVRIPLHMHVREDVKIKSEEQPDDVVEVLLQYLKS